MDLTEEGECRETDPALQSGVENVTQPPPSDADDEIARIVAILVAADASWCAETSWADGPADPLYLGHLAAAVAKALGGQE